MRVEGSNRSGQVAERGRARGNGGGATFSVEGGEASGRATAAAPMETTTGIEALLALQSVDDAMQSRRKALKRGTSILDVLDEMKSDLLAGRISEGRLNRLMALVQQARQASVPGLDAVLEEIELRARVELAKAGRFPAS